MDSIATPTPYPHTFQSTGGQLGSDKSSPQTCGGPYPPSMSIYEAGSSGIWTRELSSDLGSITHRTQSPPFSQSSSTGASTQQRAQNPLTFADTGRDHISTLALFEQDVSGSHGASWRPAKTQGLASMADKATEFVASQDSLYQCSPLSTIFRTKSAIQSHSRLHDPVPRKHQCVVCGKDFEHSKDLKRHAGIHTRIESSVSPMPSCSLEYLRPANMSRNIRFKHPGAYITSLTCSAKKDAIADNPPQDASIQESIEPQELGSPSATSQRVPASSSSPSTAVAAVDTNLKVQSPDTLDDVSESQADQREHQHSTETPIAESVLERIIDLSLKFQALEEEHRALLSIDPELLGPDDASTMSCLEEDPPLYDQDLTPPSDQSGEKGTDFSGRTSSQFDTVPGTSSGHFSGNSGGKRTQRDNDDEPDPNEEGNKRAKRPQVASETRSSSKLLFQCPERGCLATFHYLGNLIDAGNKYHGWNVCKQGPDVVDDYETHTDCRCPNYCYRKKCQNSLTNGTPHKRLLSCVNSPCKGPEYSEPKYKRLCEILRLEPRETQYGDEPTPHPQVSRRLGTSRQRAVEQDMARTREDIETTVRFACQEQIHKAERERDAAVNSNEHLERDRNDYARIIRRLAKAARTDNKLDEETLEDLKNLRRPIFTEAELESMSFPAFDFDDFMAATTEQRAGA